MKRLNNQISEAMKNVFKTENRRLLYRIISGWEEIIDPRFIYGAIPTKLSRNKNGYIIHIEASSYSISAFLFYQKDLIIERISNFAGIDDVKSIKINVSTGEKSDYITEDDHIKSFSYILPESIKISIEEIEDTELSSALKRVSKNFAPFLEK